MENADDIPNLRGLRVLAALNGLELFGHERGNIEVFKVLRDMGVEVMVGVNAARNGGHVAAHLDGLGFVTFALPFSNQWSWRWLKQYPRSLGEKAAAVYECSRIFRKALNEFDPTHIHLGSPLVYSYLSLALRFSRVPLIYRMGDCPPLDSPFNLRLWRMAMRRTACVVSISDYVRSMASQAGAKNITVIHNLAPSGGGDDASPERECMERPRTNLVYVGAVAEHKGLLPLVEAFARLVPDHHDLQLDIVGGSRYDAGFRAYLTQLIASRNLTDKVILHGHVGDPSGFYRCASVHVTPSLWEEPLGNVVLEAKCEGTPSVVFPSGGLPEMVRHHVDGYICREKSVDALVEALRWMLDDPVRLRRMGEAAREDSAARFGQPRFARAWAQVYRSVD